MAMGAYNKDKIPMLLPSDWEQGNNYENEYENVYEINHLGGIKHNING